MAWVAKAAVPFSITGELYFSPILGETVYVIDQDTNFYKLDIRLDQWTPLASPNYGRGTLAGGVISMLYRVLAVSPDGTRLACVSDGYWAPGGVYKTGGGRRVEIYDIATDAWTASKQTDFLILTKVALTRNVIWEDNDRLWVACVPANGTASGWQGKCVRYTISTDTWTAYAAGGQFAHLSRNWGNGAMAIKADGSIVYIGGVDNEYDYEKYVPPPTDGYSNHRLDPADNTKYCAHAYDRDKLWYYRSATTDRQGYMDVATETLHDDQFEENTDRTLDGDHLGIKDDLSYVVSHARTTYPRVMGLGTYRPIVQTDPATEIEATTATGNGNITDTGGENCDKRGVCWNTTGNPTVSDSKSEETGSFSTGAFTRPMSGLSPGTKYYVKAYAHNSSGYGYGDEVEFTTVAAPTVTTNPATEVGQTTATLNGTLSDYGGELCDVRFQYGETTDGSYTDWQSDKVTGDTFSQEVKGLLSGRVYHFRAIATNSAGTGYGADRTFHTAALSAAAHEAFGKSYPLSRAEL